MYLDILFKMFVDFVFFVNEKNLTIESTDNDILNGSAAMPKIN